MSLGRDPKETDIEYVKRALKRADESRSRARACEDVLTALNYTLETKRPVISATTVVKIPWQIPGGYHDKSLREFVLDHEEINLMRGYFQHAKKVAEQAASSYEHDATHLNREDQ